MTTPPITPPNNPGTPPLPKRVRVVGGELDGTVYGYLLDTETERPKEVSVDLDGGPRVYLPRRG